MLLLHPSSGRGCARCLFGVVVTRSFLLFVLSPSDTTRTRSASVVMCSLDAS